MTDEPFGIPEMESLYADAFAPWVRDLKLRPMEITADGARFVLPANSALSRQGGIVCGQAIAAAADTAGVLALAAKNGRFRPMTTVDMASNFLRPLGDGDVQIGVRLIANGRRMATARVDFWQADLEKLGATATCVYAYLE